MGIKMKIGSKRVETIVNTQKYLATHKEATAEDIADYLKKDYSTARRAIKYLKDLGYVKERLEGTKAKGKKKGCYSLNLYGLEVYFSLKNAFENIKEVAETHSDMLLVFRKWHKFVENNCEDAVISNMKKAVKTSVFSRYVFGPFVSGTVLIPERTELQAEGMDAVILGFNLLSLPLNHVKEVLGAHQWEGQRKIFEVVESDYDLRMVRESVMQRFEFEHSEALKALSGWSEFLKS